MNDNPSMNRLERGLSQAMKAWTTKTESKASKGTRHPTIAISRQCGAGASRIAEVLGESLGWPVYDRRLVEHIAEQSNVRRQLVESVDEKPAMWTVELVEALVGAPALNSGTFVRHLVEVFGSLAAHGNCIIIGRGSAQILPAETTLRVRLVAPRKERVARIVRLRSVDSRVAEQIIKSTDRDRMRFVMDHFHRDSTDCAGYDLCLNTSRFTDEQCSELITQAMQQLSTSGAGCVVAG